MSAHLITEQEQTQVQSPASPATDPEPDTSYNLQSASEDLFVELVLALEQQS